VIRKQRVAVLTGHTGGAGEYQVDVPQQAELAHLETMQMEYAT
jgi:hypothetical protein